MNRLAMRERFGLREGQFFAYYKHKNLHWVLNEEFFGFGDLRDEDIERIFNELSDNEIFEGFNEHHFSAWKINDLPILRITSTEITNPVFEQRRLKE